MHDSSLANYLKHVISISYQAGEGILNYWNHPETIGVKRKEDNTPLTAADLRSNEIIEKGLSALAPEIPLLSEEGNWPAYNQRRQWDRYWLVDPLDGTRGFVNHLDEFTVNIALMDKGKPVLGVIYAPKKEWYYFAYSGAGAFKRVADQEPIEIHTRRADTSALRIIIGYYHKEARLQKLLQSSPENTINRVNSSLKLGVLAEGSADLYPRIGPTSEWDTAAGQIILEEAGGIVVDLEGQPLQYNAESSLLNPEFIAMGDPSQVDYFCHLLKEEK